MIYEALRINGRVKDGESGKIGRVDGERTAHTWASTSSSQLIKTSIHNLAISG